MGMKQKKKTFFGKKFKMADSKKTEFFNFVKSWANSAKISWIRPWVSRIEWCEGHWFCSTHLAVRLADLSSKMAKKGQKSIFWAYVWQPHDHIDLATSMPFASFNPTKPRTNLRNFCEKFLRIGDFKKGAFFESAILNFFFEKKKKNLLHSHENQPKFIW